MILYFYCSTFLFLSITCAKESISVELQDMTNLKGTQQDAEPSYKIFPSTKIVLANPKKFPAEHAQLIREQKAHLVALNAYLRNMKL